MMTERGLRRAFTIVEVVIAAGVSVVAMTAVIYMLMYSSKTAQSNLSQLHAGTASRRLYEHVGFNTRQAKRIVVATDGLSVEFTRTDDVVCSYTYVDEDGDPATIMNNRMIFDPDLSVTGDQETVVSGVSPGPGGWIFSPDNPRPVLIMNFRIGDPDDDPAHISNAFTGPGAQGVDVLTRITPRNLHLWGGS
jgi:type II secretory pathway pseudopilin PulG